MMMAATKHTPGPWEHHSGDDYTVILSPGDTTDRPLAEVFSDRVADARLIAAAPDLLAALRMALPWVSAPLDGADRSASAVAHRAVVAALAKAET